jgi:hypothetical protein
MKEKLPPGEKRNKQPDEGLTLDYVFGYERDFLRNKKTDLF